MSPSPCTFSPALDAQLRITTHFPADSQGGEPKAKPKATSALQASSKASSYLQILPSSLAKGKQQSWPMALAFLTGTPPGGCYSSVCLAAACNRSSELSTESQHRAQHRRLAKRLLLLALQLQRPLPDALAREVAICSPNSPSTPVPRTKMRTTCGSQAVSVCL